MSNQPRSENWISYSKLAAFSLAISGMPFSFRWYPIGIICLIASLFFFIAFRCQRREHEISLPEMNLFDVRRDPKIKDIKTAIKHFPKLIHVISGSSGVGKSVIVQHIKADLEKERICLRYDDYSPAMASELRQKRQANDYKSVLWIFDQFENVFFQDEEDIKSQLIEVREILKKCISASDWTAVIVIRMEFYLHLHLFDFFPESFKIHRIGGMNQEQEVDAWKEFSDKIRGVLSNKDLAKKLLEDCAASNIGESVYTLSSSELSEGKDWPKLMLPVEAVAAANALISMKKRSGTSIKLREYEKAGQIRGVMHVFFQTYMDRCGPRKNDAARILLSLSVVPRGKRALSIEEISYITKIPSVEVEELLGKFKEAKLLQPVGITYDWSHEFYAERFYEYSGEVLDAADRDNIRYFWERVQSETKEDDEEYLRPSGTKFARAVFVASLVLLWIKPAMAWLSAKLPSVQLLKYLSEPLFVVNAIPPEVFDISFIPVAVSLTAWSWYTTTLYGRVLSRAREGIFERLFSCILPIWSLILIALTVIYPKWWICFVGLGGLVVGMKFIQIGLAIGKRRPWFRDTGIATCANSIMAFGAGLLYVRMFPPDSFLKDSTPAVLSVVTLCAMCVMLYFDYKSSKIHTNRAVVPILLGNLDRYSAKQTIGKS